MMKNGDAGIFPVYYSLKFSQFTWSTDFELSNLYAAKIFLYNHGDSQQENEYCGRTQVDTELERLPKYNLTDYN